MMRNIGRMDRVVRVIVGIFVAAIGFGFVYGGFATDATLKIVMDVLGIEIFLTGLTGWSPLYWTFGYSSCTKHRHASF